MSTVLKAAMAVTTVWALTSGVCRAEAGSGVYAVAETFADGAKLTGRIDYNAKTRSIEAADLQLLTAEGVLPLTKPNQAYQTENGFAQKLISFTEHGMVEVTLVLDTKGPVPRLDLDGLQPERNNYAAMLTSGRSGSVIKADADGNSIRPLSGTVERL